MIASISFDERMAFARHSHRMKQISPENADIGARIRQLRDEVMGLSQEAFATQLGVTRGAVGNWELGKGIKRENVQRIALVFDQPMDWLMTGRGSPIDDPRTELQEKLKLVGSFDPDEDGNGYNRENWRPSMPGAIPEIDAKLGAGEGSVGELVNLRVGDDNYSGHRVVAEWILSETFLRHEAKASRQDTVIMEIIGDSMSPTYGPGDRVLVDQAQTRLVADTVYAISDGYGEPQIKRLQRIPFSDPVMVKIISDNPSLSSFDVELERLTIIGRVCGHIARK